MKVCASMFAVNVETDCFHVIAGMNETTFADWLRRQLHRREWTQADFARKLGVGTGTVANWATGARIPSPGSVDRVADAMGVDVDYLLTVTGHRPPVFEIDPDSPEAKLVPLIRQVDWASRPGRLEEIEAEYRMMIDFDRKRRLR